MDPPRKDCVFAAGQITERPRKCCLEIGSHPSRGFVNDDRFVWGIRPKAFWFVACDISEFPFLTGQEPLTGIESEICMRGDCYTHHVILFSFRRPSSTYRPRAYDGLEHVNHTTFAALDVTSMKIPLRRLPQLGCLPASILDLVEPSSRVLHHIIRPPSTSYH